MAKVESKVADAVLQRPHVEEICGVRYEIAPPSTATLILVSELVASLPQVDLGNDDMLTKVLRVARHCRTVGDIVATLMLGALGLKETKIVKKSHLFGLWKTNHEVTVDKVAVLSKVLLERMTPSDLFKLSVRLFNLMEISDFFALTASLLAANVTKPTKEAVTTASGR